MILLRNVAAILGVAPGLRLEGVQPNMPQQTPIHNLPGEVPVNRNPRENPEGAASATVDGRASVPGSYARLLRMPRLLRSMKDIRF